MSLTRLNRLLMADILPFNFGMDYEGWVKVYDDPYTRELCPTDPRTWTEKERELVNQIAAKEAALCDRLMSLDDEAFYKEVERLAKEQEQDGQAT